MSGTLTPVPPLDFRNAMARVAAAVHVVATDGPAGRHGVTISAFASVSDAPPTLLICLNRTSRSNDAIKANGVFSVSTLAAGQEGVARLFATRAGGDPAARFAPDAWQVMLTGAPVFRHVVCAFDCRVSDVVEKGTHTVFFAEVLAAVTPDAAEALVYANRGYRAVRL